MQCKYIYISTNIQTTDEDRIGKVLILKDGRRRGIRNSKIFRVEESLSEIGPVRMNEKKP
jgi:hypothetical protein